MFDLLQESFRVYNLPFTILLLIVLIYWIVALCGLVDLDGGADLDLDMDVDADLDMDVDAGEGGGGNVMGGLLRWVGFSEAPLILLLSLLSLFTWATNLLANHYFNPANSLIQATILFVPVSIISIIITRLLLKPLAPLMRSIKGEEPSAQIIGEEAKVISASIDNEFGRIEVDFDGKPILLNAVLTDGKEPLSKGEKVLVVSQRQGSTTYVVRPLREKF